MRFKYVEEREREWNLNSWKLHVYKITGSDDEDINIFNIEGDGEGEYQNMHIWFIAKY